MALDFESSRAVPRSRGPIIHIVFQLSAEVALHDRASYQTAKDLRLCGNGMDEVILGHAQPIA
jgi:hypothetical protein